MTSKGKIHISRQRNVQYRGQWPSTGSDFVTSSYGESGTHLVKNHESQYRTIVTQFKKKMSPWVFCSHTANLKIDSKTLYCILLRSKDTPSIVKHRKD